MRLARVAIVLISLPGATLGAVAQARGAPRVREPLDRPLAIGDAVVIALANHPSVTSARHQIDAAQAAILQAGSGLRPSVGLQAGYTHSAPSGAAADGGVVGGGGDTYSAQYSTSLGVDQLLFDFGRTGDGLRETRLKAQAAELRGAQTEDDVADNARQTFLALIANGELLEVAQYRVRLQEGTLAMAQAQFDEGIVPGADVAKASAALASARLEVEAARNAVAQARVALNGAMGIDVRTDYEVTVPTAPDIPELSLDELLEAGCQTRPDLLAARADTLAAEAALAAARKGQKPSVSANGSYGARDGSFPPTQDSWSLGVSLSVSLWDGGATKGRARQARAQLASAGDAEYDTAQRIAQETAQAFLDLQTARERIAAAEASVASATEDHELATGRYRANVGILLEVLDAQTNLTSAQVELAQARFDLLSAYYALERAVGGPLTQLPAGAGEQTGPVAAPGDEA